MRAMPYSLMFSLSAMAALIPLTLVVWRRDTRRDATFWVLAAVALAGPLAWAIAHFGAGWQAGLAATLWIIVLSCLGLFLIVAATTGNGWRLATLLLPYLVLFALVATIWDQAPEHGLSDRAPAAWVGVHIAVSVITYGLLTLSAIAGLAVVMRESAMKAKRRGLLSDQLPSVADAENLQVRLLQVSEAVLGLGLVTGMAIQFIETGNLLVLDHKTLLTIGGFVMIAGLLFAHYRTGLRGRRAARLVLIAYLLVTLGYPGVKFVRDVLLA